MSTMRRHIGRMKKTDQRIVVAFMQIPGKEDHSLVVPTEGLPARLEQYLMQIVESSEGQGTTDLGTILGRRMMPDSQASLLQTLHDSGLLQRVHVDNVIMYPVPSQAYPLRQILQTMGRIVPEPTPDVLPESYYPPAAPVAPAFDPSMYADDDFVTPQLIEEDADPVGDLYARSQPVEKFNQHTSNQQSAAADQNLLIARNLLAEADDFFAIANQKREQAYKYAPQLRAPAPVAPAPRPVRTAAPVAPTPAPVAAKTTRPRAKVEAAKPTAKKPPAKKASK